MNKRQKRIKRKLNIRRNNLSAKERRTAIFVEKRQKDRESHPEIINLEKIYKQIKYGTKE